MKILPVFVILLLLSSDAFAQTIEERLDSLEKTIKKQEQNIQELKTLQKTVKNQEEIIRSQQKLITELKSVASKPVQPVASTTAPVPDQEAASEQLRQEVKELKEKVDETAAAGDKNLLSQFNPAIGVVGEMVFGYRSKGKNETGSDRPGGFDANFRSMELNLAASVDPYARGYAVINASADPFTGEAKLGVEEAALVTTSLPTNLTLTAGRFFGEFGRLSYIHDHELPFVNRPVVLDKYIGGESKTDGVQVNYLFPIDHYVSLTFGIGDQFGDTPNNVGDFRSFDKLNFWGRTSTSFDLTPDITLEPGVSGLLNAKSLDRGGAVLQTDGSTMAETERRVLGADLVFNFKPLSDNQFRGFTWGTEVLLSDNRYDVTPTGGGTIVHDRLVDSTGLYSYVAYKFHRQWSAGFLYDWAENPMNSADRTSAYSPFITWNLSHWNQLRLQYTHTDHNAVSGLRPDDAVYLQWTWIIGAHSHGWQSR